MADVSVRPAGASDVGEIARIQVETWRTAYAALLPPDALATATPELATARWQAAVVAPPSAAHRVLVALEGAAVVGFVAFGPDDEETMTGSIATLLVEPRWGRRGHGSRLLAAAVEHVRGDGVGRFLVWVLERDTASTGFFESAGWERDGWVRTLDVAGTPVREARLHTSLDDSAT